ncbi:hypothetical protein KC331_g44 [Hortaea werneckii]|nr:hypothetical protein KC331_g44 [Hortaea werneckii]
MPSHPSSKYAQRPSPHSLVQHPVFVDMVPRSFGIRCAKRRCAPALMSPGLMHDGMARAALDWTLRLGPGMAVRIVVVSLLLLDLVSAMVVHRVPYGQLCASSANGQVVLLFVVVYSHVMLALVARVISVFAMLSLSSVGRHSAIWLSSFVRRPGWGLRATAHPLTSSPSPTEASSPAADVPPCRETVGARENSKGSGFCHSTRLSGSSHPQTRCVYCSQPMMTTGRPRTSTISHVSTP